jgi:hypothetical protein
MTATAIRPTVLLDTRPARGKHRDRSTRRPPLLRRIGAVAAIAAGILGGTADDADAAGCHPHPDVCEQQWQPTGTDHMPPLEGSAPLATCVLWVCW